MPVTFETTERIAILTINRPLAMNALDGETLAALNKAWIDFRDNPELWVAIITGAGVKAFCAGADIKGLAQLLQQHDCDPAEVKGRQGTRAGRDHAQP